MRESNYENVTLLEFDLTHIYESFKLMFIEDINNLALANSRARLRMTTLYQIAQTNKGLVVGTGNKVEDFGVGFYTKYGDGGVDISPIADLMNINSREEHKSLLKIIDQNNATLNVEVRCEGHTDDAKLPPNAEYPSNWELSAARSLNLVRLMNKHAGMPEKYFSALGYGEFRPVIYVSNIPSTIEFSFTRRNFSSFIITSAG